jgi:flagellar motor protein MotB
MIRQSSLLMLLWASSITVAAGADSDSGVAEVLPGNSVERHLSSDEPVKQWVHDPELLATESGDRLEMQQVAAEEVETVKLTNLVPPIGFESGFADIPPSYVAALREILDGMRDRRNVRLHLVGHADDQPLSDALARVFGDNAGLSRERAGEVAEFFQASLGLPPESVSYEWAGDTRPIASNSTAAGRALNRRVEVEVWYDESKDTLAEREVLVAEEFKRVKVCRIETVCKLRYMEGHARRARVRNLVAPLHYEDDNAAVPAEFVAQIRQALHNLRDRQNVTVKFVGFTDDQPLVGRAARIYGDHLALSRARAHRVALAVQDALVLPSATFASDGRGISSPLASNETARGRALNRRIEAEFWYDDPLQELPDEPQLCPDPVGDELVTRVYDPPWGRIAPLELDHGRALVPSGYAEQLRRAMADVSGRQNVRLRFIGYTANERLDRRTAMVYGDDIGLSAARARRAKESLSEQLELSPAQAEHEGRGYLHANDVVNAGFIQGDTSHVVVQVVYDELLPRDDLDGVDVTPLTRELKPKDPLALNLMRITVDGEPLDDPNRSSSDIQRCTDVALDRAALKFSFDNLVSRPRLAVTAWPSTVAFHESDEGLLGSPVRFRTYTNYSGFIARGEVRVFEHGQSLQAEPLAVLPVDRDGLASWEPVASELSAPVGELKYLLRVYDEIGNFDETRPQALWMVYRDVTQAEAEAEAEADAAAAVGPMAEADVEAQPQPPAGELLAVHGENSLALQNIPLGRGAITVQGSGIPPQHSVWVAGRPVPIDADGKFVAEEIVASGMHTVEVAILDESGNGELYLRDLELERNDWFYVGIADLTLSNSETSGPADLLKGENAPYAYDSSVDGRLAFFLSGSFREDWQLTASADTREGPVKDLFSNFMDKSPDALFRRLDPDYYYPTFGDDGTVEETAPTLGKFYARLSQHENHALWGNFKVSYMQNELAQVDRGLYGGNLHYQSPATTAFGEQRLVFDGFAAEPGTLPSREEFRGTGGSLYFLRRQDLLAGSERVRIEIRDKDSGLVTGVVNLRPALDYDIDYLQGRILLTEPLASTVDDRLLVRSGGLSGDEAWLVVRYEYSPGFDSIDTLSVGGQAQYWLNDSIKLGLTANSNEEGDSDSSLNAADLTFRKSTDSWLKLQAARSEGLVSSSLRSDDGGFGFQGVDSFGFDEADAGAYRADVSVGIADYFENGKGRVTLYTQNLDAGYSAPGQTALLDTEQFGGTFSMPVTESLEVNAKADRRLQDAGLETTAQQLDVGYQLNDHWNLGAGVRNDLRKDRSPVVPLTQQEGERTDAVVQLGYDSKAAWRSYGFVQDTLSTTGEREDNGRVGLGGAYRFGERLMVEGEVSEGDLGAAGKLGTNYLHSERTRLYVNYALENERTDNGLHARRGNLVSGARSRLSDSSSVYLEERYQHTDLTTGLTHATGVSLVLAERWNLGANSEFGTLRDRETSAETRRKAGGVRAGYGFETVQVASAVEYRFDETQQLDGSNADRTTWLFRNSFKYQMTPDWRMVGKFNHAESDSSLGQVYDGGYTEAVLGYAYRPVRHDRLNALAKYTYFYNVPTTDQVAVANTPVQFIQKSHIAALDVMYDLTARWSVGGKYAYRLGQVSLDREDRQFFDNSAHLYVLRTDLRFWGGWEALLEGRMLDLPDLGERRNGALVALYRHVGKHVKVGAGYNFSEFSDDLTDLNFNHQGVFINLVGSM